MVKKDAVAGKNVVSLTVVNHDPVGIQLGHRIWGTRIKRRLFSLGHLTHLAI